MNAIIKAGAASGLLLMMLASCSSDNEPSAVSGGRPEMAFDCSYATTRVANDAFENNDRIGVFVTEAGSRLQIGGNVVNNELFSFNGTSWTASLPVYWDEGTFDVYAYYPYRASVGDVEDYEFELPLDQSTPEGFSSADFLWASREGVEGSGDPVSLQFSHRLSKVVVKLEKGENFEGEIPSDCEVYIHSTATTATVDLTTGDASTALYSPTGTIRALAKSDAEFEAIVVPQNIDSRRPLVEVVTQGVSYLMEGRLSFRQGYAHTLVVTLSKNPEQIKIEIGGSIDPWQ